VAGPTAGPTVVRVRTRRLLTTVLSGMLLVVSVVVSISVIDGQGDPEIRNVKEIQRAHLALVGHCRGGDRTICEMLPVLELAFDGDTTGALEMLEGFQNRDDDFRTKCHEISHIIGKVSYYEIGIAATIKDLPGGCAGGIHHGALEQWGFDDSLEHMQEIAGSVCDPLLDEGSVSHEVCVHGVGHALERNILGWERAADLCEKVYEEGDRGSCVIGAVSSQMTVHHAELKVPYRMDEIEDFIQRCQTLPADMAAGCVDVVMYQALPTLAGPRFAEGLALCLRLENYDENCANGVGMTAANANVGDPGVVVEICRDNAGDLLDACLGGGSMWVAMNLQNESLAREICTPDGQVLGSRCREVLDQIEEIVKGQRNLDTR
jgi:hypothetical protein